MMTEISIHALLAESDGAISQLQCALGNFYPRSPCGERLRLPTALRTPHQRFLSTLSLRRATRGGHIIKTRAKNFYPRSPCGERRAYLQYLCELSLQNFYPRSPCGERRLFLLPFYTRQQFLSTLSLRRATRVYDKDRCIYTGISIHALLAESDRIFNSPFVKFALFLSTLSLRRATMTGKRIGRTTTISIHALLAESDPAPPARSKKLPPFLSTLSLRRATQRG